MGSGVTFGGRRKRSRTTEHTERVFENCVKKKGFELQKTPDGKGGRFKVNASEATLPPPPPRNCEEQKINKAGGRRGCVLF